MFETIQKKEQNNSIQKKDKKSSKKIAADPKHEEFAKQYPIQKKESNQATASAADTSKSNQTGLPNHLKTGVESLSGFSMDDVKVHYNSPKPNQINAHAYAQGTDIHVASGQEKHLAHEAWHVVQQKQGRVTPTMQMKGIAVNDNSELEKEADEMGAKAQNIEPTAQAKLKGKEVVSSGGVLQPKWEKQNNNSYKWDEPVEGVEWITSKGKISMLVNDENKIPVKLKPYINKSLTEREWRGIAEKDKIEELHKAMNSLLNSVPLPDVDTKTPLHEKMMYLAENMPEDFFEGMLKKGLNEEDVNKFKENNKEYFNWKSGTICDITAYLAMGEALGVDNVENIKGDIGNSGFPKFKANINNPEIQTKHFAGKTNSGAGFKNAFSDWASKKGKGVMQVKLTTPGHTFVFERLESGYIVFYQSYEGTFTLNEFMTEVNPEGPGIDTTKSQKEINKQEKLKKKIEKKIEKIKKEDKNGDTKKLDIQLQAKNNIIKKHESIIDGQKNLKLQNIEATKNSRNKFGLGQALSPSYIIESLLKPIITSLDTGNPIPDKNYEEMFGAVAHGSTVDNVAIITGDYDKTTGFIDKAIKDGSNVAKSIKNWIDIV